MYLVNKIEDIFKFLITTMSGGMLLIIFVQVVIRYSSGFLADTDGAFAASYLSMCHIVLQTAEELARYMFVYMVFLGLPLVAKQGGHMAIDTLTMRVSEEKRRILNLVAEAITSGFMLLMTVQGIKMVRVNYFQLTPGLEIPISIVFMAIPLGCGFMMLDSLIKMYHIIASRRHVAKEVGV
ncbi:MAG: TRAP transporter small permease [Desulfovibrionaceae bacterium]|jgi:TRAP-type C4-dicarboxylate transport system permease small subunit|nr:TRAP transporter small permease [Desulfovibrionaceae bacterium]